MKHWLSSFLILFALTLHANVAERYYATSSGKASFTSDAPLELISASTEQMTGLIDPLRRTFAFNIPIKSFDGFNCSLQRDHFNEKFMESDKYPDATFTGKLPFDFEELKKGMQTINVFGVLKIHGVQKERTIKVNVFVADQMLILDSKFSVPLEDHYIEVPSILGAKIATEIKIEVKAIMKLKFEVLESASIKN